MGGVLFILNGRNKLRAAVISTMKFFAFWLVISVLTPFSVIAQGVVPSSSGSHLYQPSISSCPIANCPTNPEILSNFLFQSQTIGSSTQPEFGSVEGLYINTGSPNGQKAAKYIGAVQGPDAGTGWALNTDVVRNATPNGPNGQVGSGAPGTPGAISSSNGTVGYEADFTNWNGDCVPGGCFAVDLYLHNQSEFKSLAAIYLDASPQSYDVNSISVTNGGSGYSSTSPPAVTISAPPNSPSVQATASAVVNSSGVVTSITITNPGMGYSSTAPTVTIAAPASGTTATATATVIQNFAWSDGILFNAASLVSDNTIMDSSNSSYSYQSVGTHSSATFYANDTSPTALLIAGNHSAADINDTGSGPVGYSVSSTHTFSDISDSSSSSVALTISGSHATEDINDTASGVVAINIQGAHTSAAISVNGDSAPVGMALATNQQICFDALAKCMYFSPTSAALVSQMPLIANGITLGVTPSTATLGINPPVSGTAYQWAGPGTLQLACPVTLNPTSTAAASVSLAIGSSSTLGSTMDAFSLPSGATVLAGMTQTEKAEVPAGWYYGLTATNATIGTCAAVVH